MPKIDLGKVVGEDAKITIGTTTTLDAGNDATVENVGTKSDAVLNFGIPKGYTPIKGTDYWTENDIDEIHDYVDEQISAIDLTPYSEKTETGHSIELSIDAQTYVMTATLKNVSGDVLNTQTIDLPLETMVVSGSYDSATKEVVLTLQSGSTIRFSVSDLVDGLVSESDLEVTLADYVSRETLDSIVGDLSELDTTDKSNLVSAINEVASSGGESGSLFIDSEENGHDNTIEFINRYLNYGFTDCWVNWGTVLRRIRGVNPTVYSNYVALNIGVDNGIPETPNQTTYYGITYYTAYRFENKIIYVSREEYENKNITEIYENTNLSDIATKGLYTTTRSILKMAVIDETRCPLAIKNTSSYTPTGDYNPATKKYVDDAVASAGGGEQIPTLVLDEPYAFNSGGSVYDSDMLSFFSTRITEMLTETPKNGLVLIKYNTSGKTEVWCCTENVSSQSTQYNFYLVNTEIKNANYRYALAVRGTWTNDIFTCSYIMTVQDSYSFILSNQVLTKTNNDSYTPTSNYHPATKKYVDDSIAAAITTTLGGSY